MDVTPFVNFNLVFFFFSCGFAESLVFSAWKVISANRDNVLVSYLDILYFFTNCKNPWKQRNAMYN